MNPGRRSLLLGLLLAGMLSAGLALVARASGILAGVEQRSIVARYEVRGASPPKDLVVVAVDDRTFSQLERQWPFPRSLHAKAVDALTRAGAREIVYDVQFTEPTSEREDTALYRSLQRSRGVVLATSEYDDDGSTNVLGGDANLAAAGSVAAAANLPDGVFDHFSYASGPLRSLAVTAAERAGGPKLDRSAFDDKGNAWIDFRGPPGTIPTVSFSDLILGRLDPALFRGRTVVIGASAPSLQDIHATPTGSEPMPGAEVQANAIWTAMHGLPLRDAPPSVVIVLVFLMAFALPLLRLKVRVLPAALAAPALALVFVVLAQIAFEHGTVVDVAAPLVAVGLGTLAMVVVSHLSESAARQRVAHANDVLEARVSERTQELRETQLEILQRLSRAAEWRDEDTGHHIARMGRLSERLALALGLPAAEAELLGNAAVAHDIGKIAIPDRILLKPGQLTPDERRDMQRHAVIGASMLADSRSPVIQLAEEIALSHHERWDGGGYPNGTRGTGISLAGRICALCDVFDALVSRRPYKDAWSPEAALDEIRSQSGRHFDPAVVDAFDTIAERAYAELYVGSADCPPAAERRAPALAG